LIKFGEAKVSDFFLSFSYTRLCYHSTSLFEHCRIELLPEGIFNLKIILMDRTIYNSAMISRNTAFTCLEGMKNLFFELSVEDTQMVPTLRFDPAIKAVLFDIYGTLLISEAGDIGLANLDGKDNKSFRIKLSHGYKDFSFNTIKKLLSESVARYHKKIREENKNIEYPEVDIITLWNDMFQILDVEHYGIEELCRNSLCFELVSNKVSLMPGVHSILRFIREESIPMGIISNAQYYTPLLIEYLTGMTLKELGFEKELTAWSYEHKCGKPDTALFRGPLEFLSKRGIKNHEILYVGNDMLNDITASSALGMKTALFAGDKRSLRLREDDDRVSGVSPDFIITELNQLKQIFEEGMDG